MFDTETGWLKNDKLSKEKEKPQGTINDSGFHASLFRSTEM